MTELTIGQQLAAMRKAKPRECAVCGKSFTTKGRGIYCSATCKQRAWRKRQAAAGGHDDG